MKNFYEMLKLVENPSSITGVANLGTDPVPLDKIPKDLAKAAVGTGRKDPDESGKVNPKDDIVAVNPSASGPVSGLKPTQSTLDPNKFVGFAISNLLGTFDLTDMKAIVAAGNEIMDGHHRWAAVLCVDPNRTVKYCKVNLALEPLITILNVYTKGHPEINRDKGNEAPPLSITEAFEEAKKGFENALKNGIKVKTGFLQPSDVARALANVPNLAQGTGGAGNVDSQGNPVSYNGQPGTFQQNVSAQNSSVHYDGFKVNEVLTLAGLHEQDGTGQQDVSNKLNTQSGDLSRLAQAGLELIKANIDKVKNVKSATNLPREQMPVIETSAGKVMIQELADDLKNGNIDFMKPFSREVLAAIRGGGKGQAPAGQAPAGQAPAGQAPAGQAPAGQAPAGQAPAGQAPVQRPAAQPVQRQAAHTSHDGPSLNECLILAGLIKED